MEPKSHRQLAAILAADIVGFSRHVERSEEITVAELRSRRKDVIDPLISRYSGRIANTAGDSLLLEFNSAVDAVRFAQSFQKEMGLRNLNVPEDRQLSFRIGINVGDVIREGADLLGDAVNVAARLEALAEPGGICLARSVRDQIDGKLDLALDELGEIRVKNMSRPIEALRVIPGEGGKRQNRASQVPGKRRIWVWAMAAVALGGLTIVGFLWRETATSEFEPAVAEAMAYPLPDRPSIVVLPFANLSGDPAQTAFSDGITEDLITDLSKLSSLFVIGRHSSFAYRETELSIKDISEKLGVRYVLTGSVRRSDQTLRINAQLVDALKGEHVWAERFDGAVSDVFATQDAFTLKVLEALEVELSASETAGIREQETSLVAAREAFQRGWEAYSHFSEEGNIAAIPQFEEAVALDPNYGRAYGALALAHLRGVIFHHWDQFTDRQSSDALHLERFAVNLRAANEHDTSLIHVVRTVMQLSLRDTREAGAGAVADALIEAGQAIAAQPNDPEAHIAMAWALLAAEKPREALSFVQTAKRLDPTPPGHYAMFAAAAHFALGDLEAAREVLERALQDDPGARELLPVMASILAQSGQREQAHAMIDRWLPTDDWSTREAAVEKYFFIVRWEGASRSLNSRFREGLRLASLPPRITVSALSDELSGRLSAEPFKAARYLGWFGPDAAPAVPSLIEALSSDDRLLQKEAAIALGKIGPRAAAALPKLETLTPLPLIGYHAKRARDLISGN